MAPSLHHSIFFICVRQLVFACPISMISSTRFRLAELTAFIEISDFIFAFQIFLNVIRLPSFIFKSLILSITIFDRIVLFRVQDRYSTSMLPSCCVAFMGELTSLSSVAESINNSINLPSHSSNLSRISRDSGLLRPVFNNDWGPYHWGPTSSMKATLSELHPILFSWSLW